METINTSQSIEKPARVKLKKNKPVMSNRQIIDRIKAAGYKIKIIHYRYFGRRLLKNADVRVLLKAAKIMGEDIAQDIRNHGELIMNFGGATEVDASKSDLQFHSKVECSLSDPFTYSKGSRLALYRLLNQLPDNDMQQLKQEMKTAFLRYQLQRWNKVKWENVGKSTIESPPLINSHDFRLVESFE